MTTISLESYPPIFRQSKPQSPKSLNSGESVVVVLDPIPCIDLRSLVESDEEAMARLGEACRDWGVFRLVNHGIPLTLLSQLQERTRDLLSLTFEEKNDMFSRNPVSYFWGTPALTPSGTSLSTGRNINWVEGLSVNVSQLSQIQLSHNQHYANALASYRDVLEEYGKHLGRLGTAIFKAMLENLDKIECATKSKTNLYCESTGLLRIYRYPPDNSGEARGGSSSWGMDVHTDSSILSVLSQDQVGGLEVLKDDQWFSVKPLSNTLIVNLGDMMQAISNDKYKSVKHRVRANKGKERVSVCYFVFPGEGSVIKSSKYRPFTYTEFQAQVQQDIKTLGYKVGLQRFKKAHI